MTSPTVESEIVLNVFAPLTVADRSDANPSAQALIRVVKGGKDLLLDGHAFSKHEPILLAQGWQVFEDVRHTINEKPGGSAAA
jgi:hypothetical protein